MKLLLLAVFSTFLVGISGLQGAQGLNYKYYEGTWNLLPDFNALTPVKTGSSTSPNLDPRNKEKQYGFLYQGFITIPAAGNYTFETMSDDGSKLYIGDYGYNTVALVNNDGLHANQTRAGTIALNAGVYPIAITFFQNDGGQTWEFYWSSNTGVSRQKIPSSVLSTTNTTTTGGSGLNYRYYEGSWALLPDFGLITPVKTGVAKNVSLDPRNREKLYSLVYQGYITIPTSGNYTFETMSDDGSKLYIGNYGFLTPALVNNDGAHATQSRTGTITMTAGVYPITLTYLQIDGGQTLELYWSSNTGIGRQKIPDNAFSTSSSGPEGPSSGVNYNYYEGTWSNLPDFNLLTPVKTGTTSNIDLSPRNREVNYGFVWQGNINVPASGTYTFETISDDGSKVYVGSSSVPTVNNDGLHANQSRTGTIALNAGFNPITVTFFQNGGGQTMELYWSSNVGLARQKVADNAFSATSVTPPIEEIPVPVPIPEPPTTPGTSGSGGLTGNNNYYFSSTSGDDSRSSSQAKNPATPWRTINKLNSVLSTLQAGDAVLLNRGDIFDGAINFTTSGGNNNPIILSSYGNGNKPVVNGLSAITGWTNLGNGVWQANCPSTDKVNMVTMNGIAQALGRYPNITEPNRGYLSLEAHAGAYLITDYQLNGTPNFTGAEVVIRKNNWVLDRCLITNHSGNNIYYTSPTSHEPSNGYGYFIQNSASTLDQLGEWYFDQNNRVLKMYFGSNNPGSYEIKASTVNALLTISGKSNFTIDNISFIGGDDYGIKMENAQNIRIQNSNLDNSGMQGVSATNVSNLIFEANTISNTSNDAIDGNATSYSLIKNNVIKNTGQRLGMGGSGNQQYNGILMEGSGNTIELNTVENTGYSGITFAGENCLVKNNFVNTFCTTVEDGGGIYGWGDLYKYNRKIIGNIILNGIGAFEGTNYATSTGATGIFHDDESANVEMTDNTISNCSRAGIFIHNSHEMSISNNTIYNNRTQVSMVHDPISIFHPIRNIALNNNILFSKYANQFIMEMSSTANDLTSFGTYNNNYYARPIDENGIINTLYREASGSYLYAFYDVDGWKTTYRNYDQQSKSSPMKIPAFKINSYNGGNRYANGSFDRNVGNVYCLSSPGRCSVDWSNNGRMDGGSVQVSHTSAGSVNNNVGTYIDIGSTTAGHSYQIKFSLLGNNSGKTIKLFILDGGNYAHLSDIKYFAISSSKTENEFMYIAPSSAGTTLLAFEIAGTDCPFWLDNMQVYDVNTTITDPDEYIRFEYNASNSGKTVSLNGDYVDARNNYYSGSIYLAPFSSAVLINKSASQLVSETATERQANVTAGSIVQEEAVKGLDVTVTPNPVTRNLHLVLNAPQGTQKSTLSIHTISGVTMKNMAVSNTNQNLDIDVSTWSKGVYIVNFVCDGKIIYKKFVKN